MVTIIKILLLSFLALALSGCNDESGGCPDGGSLIGSPPPKGSFVYCAKSEYGIIIKHGEYKSWELGGEVKEVGQYENNKKIGSWFCFSPEGEWIEQEWENGTMAKGDPCR